MHGSKAKSASMALMMAVIFAIAATVIGVTTTAAPAYAATYVPGTYVEDATTIPQAKSSLAGTWKLVKSTKKADNNIIKHNKKVNAKAKCTMSLKKNGKLVLKDFTGATNRSYKWVATSKKAGFLTYLGIMVSPIKVKGKTLKITFPSAGTTKGFTWTMKKI